MLTKESKACQKKENKKAVEKANCSNIGFLRCTTSEFSPVRLLKHFGRKVAKGLIRIFRPSLPKVISSSSSTRPKPPVVDSHRNAAVEDCIQFINSSASLPRSNRLSATSH
ncbi:hypothetical protein F3Y22_tig00110419pilonHSYRG00094 [Hibiscus syriacus]|uniref:Josephin-like protein n=1 Tax=Hibiscus syriacus TaxID=106335 RepID=A0A6A3AP48_HIBSY|nr:hypothetical protein F3Y22_tig00110419pilonHSYRG00094 [Hibiscus syriacus]